jgi:hypothetical protein
VVRATLLPVAVSPVTIISSLVTPEVGLFTAVEYVAEYVPAPGTMMLKTGVVIGLRLKL